MNKTKTVLIADIGNNHFGSIDVAKNLIVSAWESGATLVKGQAFIDTTSFKGSMPYTFYRQCSFTLDQYLSLLDFAEDREIPFFFSLFGHGLQEILNRQKFHKMAASQTKNSLSFIKMSDLRNQFISLNSGTILDAIKYNERFNLIVRAVLMLATPYRVEKIDWSLIDKLKSLAVKVGLSDHSIGMDNCIKAHIEYDIKYIEKHFTLKNNIEFDCNIYRDTVHGLNPSDFELMAIKLNAIQFKKNEVENGVRNL